MQIGSYRLQGGEEFYRGKIPPYNRKGTQLLKIFFLPNFCLFSKACLTENVSIA